jgi:hypothetical protein
LAFFVRKHKINNIFVALRGKDGISGFAGGFPPFSKFKESRLLLVEFLKKLWPMPFRIKAKDVTSLVVQLVIFVIVCAVVGVLIGLLAKIPVLGILFGIIGGLLELYALIGIVLSVLVYFDMLK